MIFLTTSLTVVALVHVGRALIGPWLTDRQ
jgi:hypothetical protein